MNKIIKVALATVFNNEEQIDNIMEIIQNTPNPEVAVNILLGLYEEPIIPLESFVLHTDRTKVCIFDYYDKWQNQVYYKFEMNKSEQVRVGLDVDKTLINENNYTDYEAIAREQGYNYNNQETVWEYHTVVLSTIETRTGNVRLDTWLGKRPK
jgi:hypothetical protein